MNKSTNVSSAAALTTAARTILTLACDPDIDQLDLMELYHKISDLHRDASRAADAGQIDFNAYFEIKLACRTISDLVDDRDPDSWVECVAVESFD